MTSKNEVFATGRPLAQVLLRKLLVASVILALVILGIQSLVEYRSNRQATITALQSLSTAFEPGLAVAVWTYEEAQLNSMVHGIGLHPDVVLVEVIDSKGKVAASWRKPATESAADDLQILHPLSLPNGKGASKQVGTLQISASEALIRRHLAPVLLFQFIATFLLLVSLGSVLWYLVKRYALEPLGRFTDQVRTLSGTGLDESFDFGETDVTEILTLHHGFKQLMHQVGESHARIAEQNYGLEQQVLARTGDLEKKNTELVAANQAKSDFLATMSHEIRTPMNGILGMIKLLEHTELTSRQADYANKAERATRALLGIINDILDFSKVEAGKLELELEDFALGELLRDLSTIVSANLQGKAVEVLFAVAPDVPRRLVGDALRLRQVLLNLTGNAIKFTEEGEVLLSINVLGTAVDANGTNRVTLEFAVQDSGIGIPADKLAYVFQGFSQAESSTTRRFGGTGLGLSISKRLVALMGGDLQVESQLGMGSRFHFSVEFPVSTTAQIPREPTTTSTHGSNALRALIIDDNTTALRVMQSMVESMGWQSECVSSGEAALARLDQIDAAPIQIALVDWQMPGVDGWATVRGIRQRYAGVDVGKAPIVIMVSSNGQEMFAQRPRRELEMLNGYLVKPLTASALYDCVVDAQQSLSGTKPAASALPQVKRLAGLRVLVVEDNRLNQQIAFELLSHSGAEVEMASNGMEGVSKAVDAMPPYDAILMDIQMPDIDGLEATRRIRANAHMLDVPIIAMTANAMESDKEACRAVGMVDHVAKPIDLSVLLDTIVRYTRPTNLATPLADAVPPAPTFAKPASAYSSVSASASLSSSALLNIDVAVARLGGDRRFYDKVLISFEADAPTLMHQTKQYLTQAAANDAARCAHTLKGLASTIGAQTLANLASDLEAGLKKAPLNLAELRLRVEQFEDLLNDVLSEVAEMTGLDNATNATIADYSPSAESVDEDALKQALVQLLGLLQSNNMSAIDQCAQICRDHLAALDAPRREQLTALDAAVNQLDFAKARTLCQELTG